MSSHVPTIDDAYVDNKELQDALHTKISASALSLQLPKWFTALRAATASLNDGAIDATACEALASHINLQNSVNTAKVDMEREITAIKLQEKIWRAQAQERGTAVLASERRSRASEEFNAKNVKSLTSTLKDFVAKFKKLEDGEPNEELKVKMGKNLEKLAASIAKITETWAKHELAMEKGNGKKRTASEGNDDDDEEVVEEEEGGPQKQANGLGSNKRVKVMN